MQGLARTALIVAAALVVACAPAAPNDSAAPEAAFDAFRDALAARDHETTWAFLGPQTQEALTTLAEASPNAAAEHPAALLNASWVLTEIEIDTLERAAFDGDTATLAFTTIFGAEGEVDMVRIDDRWRFELALSDAPATAAPDAPAAPAAPEVPAAPAAPDVPAAPAAPTEPAAQEPG